MAKKKSEELKAADESVKAAEKTEKEADQAKQAAKIAARKARAARRKAERVSARESNPARAAVRRPKGSWTYASVIAEMDAVGLTDKISEVVDTKESIAIWAKKVRSKKRKALKKEWKQRPYSAAEGYKLGVY